MSEIIIIKDIQVKLSIFQAPVGSGLQSSHWVVTFYWQILIHFGHLIDEETDTRRKGCPN